jgi:hypothetical protein
MRKERRDGEIDELHFGRLWAVKVKERSFEPEIYELLMPWARWRLDLLDESKVSP